MRNFWDLKVLILSCTFQLSQSVSEKQSENQSVSRKIDADDKPLSVIFSVKSYQTKGNFAVFH